MSNFSDVLAQSRNNSDKARYEALNRSAQMRMHQRDLEQQALQRQAQNDQFMSRLGFDREQMNAKLQESRDSQKEHESAAALDRQNRIDVANAQVGGRQNVATINTGARSADLGKKLSSQEDLFERGDETKRRGQDKGLEGQKYRADTGLEGVQARNQTALDVAGLNNTAKRDAQQQALDQREAEESGRNARHEASLAADAKRTAANSGDRRAIAAAHLAELQAYHKVNAADRYLKEASDPLADPANVKLAKQQMDEYNSQSFGDLLKSPDAQQFMGAHDETGPEGEKGPPGTPAAPDVRAAGQKLLSPKKWNDNGTAQDVQTLKGLRGPERQAAIDKFKEAIPDPQSVYEAALKQGKSEAIARKAATAAQADRQEMMHRGEPKVDAATGVDQRASNQPNALTRVGTNGYKDEGNRIDVSNIFGSRFPDWVPLLGGQDVLPGNDKPFSGGNLLDATLMTALPYVGEAAGPYVGKALGALAPYAEKLPGAGLAKWAAGKLTAIPRAAYNAVDGALDSGIDALPGIGRKLGAATQSGQEATVKRLMANAAGEGAGNVAGDAAAEAATAGTPKTLPFDVEPTPPPLEPSTSHLPTKAKTLPLETAETDMPLESMDTQYRQTPKTLDPVESGSTDPLEPSTSHLPPEPSELPLTPPETPPWEAPAQKMSDAMGEPNVAKYGGMIKPQSVAPSASEVMMGTPKMKLPPQAREYGAIRDAMTPRDTPLDANTLRYLQENVDGGIANDITSPVLQADPKAITKPLPMANSPKAKPGSVSQFSNQPLSVNDELGTMLDNAGVKQSEFMPWLIENAPTGREFTDPAFIDLMIRRFQAGGKYY